MKILGSLIRNSALAFAAYTLAQAALTLHHKNNPNKAVLQQESEPKEKAEALKRYRPPELLAPPRAHAGVDPLLEKFWHLSAIHITQAWAITHGSPQTIVAIMDSGILYNHPELSASIKRNEGDCNFDGLDDDHNGVIDDCIGANFREHTSRPWDDNGHGTFIASLIAGQYNNQMGGAGVCPSCSLLPIRYTDQDGAPSQNEKEAIRCIDYAIKMKASVLNLSFIAYEPDDETDYNENQKDEFLDALKRAGEHNIVIVAAAGNMGENNDVEPYYPANYKLPFLITVAATNHDSGLWKTPKGGSNYGAHNVHIGAPGDDVWGIWSDGTWIEDTGTSYSAPIVAGVAGLVKSANPRLTAVQIVEILKRTAKTSEKLKNKVSTSGIVDAGAAVQCAKDPQLSCLKDVKRKLGTVFAK